MEERQRRGEERGKGRRLCGRRAMDAEVEGSAAAGELNRLRAERSIVWCYVACTLKFLNEIFSLGKK